ncbi:efflux RND transporter permease subunit [Fimbriiglobus ruber]|uniref:Cobalt-zinc-cadmium resistance protein CzcA / Cation efflux system protein CusA n=1 Tax=Fimbriiglobus ruber TaxID=1908690 RepID=A0A225D440_9BACT|nr:efflux RND transporter permease subunit [Fimbriiglobus ruber]OWK36350.1 Cobalt-zinc-cadmium resistance protein CzcA / Cation efflux system protein CusA [Fimbriiglobus ruber]
MIWDICIRRPVFTTMLVLAPVVLGLASYARLGVELFPNVDVPVVVVTTTLKGASVDEMESAVTKPIEEAVNTVSGIDELRSTTKEGLSQLVIGFKLEKNGDVAAQEVRDKVSLLTAQLPVGTDAPKVEKFNLDAAPVVTLAVSGRRPLREVTEIAKKLIKEDLEGVSGVGAVVLVGGQTRAVNVTVLPDRLRALGLSVDEVRGALSRQNLETPGGRVDSGAREEGLRTVGRVRRVKDFEDVVIATKGGYPLRMKDVARVEDGVEEPRGLSRLDGDIAVSLVIQKQSGGNTVQVADAVNERLARIRPSLPADIRVEVIRDQSKFIKGSIQEVKFHLVLAALLVSGVLLLFIRDWRTTIVAALAVPTSIIGTFAFMDAMGFSLNNMTLLGLILAVGIVIDDAVVVLENVFRHMEEYGRTPWEAASLATREIALAVFATTLSLAVIFAPIAFMSGQVGRFFNSFGFVVGFAVLLSMVVSFTLTPMLCARFLRKPKEGAHGGGQTGFWGWVTRRYVGLLAWCLRRWWRRGLVVASAFALLLSTVPLAVLVGSDFVPKDDQSEFEVAITAPEGYTLEQTSRICEEIEHKLTGVRGVTNVFTTIGETSGKAAKGQGDVTRVSIYCRMTDLSARPFHQRDAMADARTIMADYPDMRTTVQEIKMFSSSAFKNVQLELSIRGPDSEKLDDYAARALKWMKANPNLTDADTNAAARTPELQVLIDRDKAADLGVSIQAVASTLQVLVGGEPVTKYKEGVEQYDVWLRADLPSRDRAAAIADLTVPSEGGKLVELRNLATLDPARGPATVERYNRQRQVTVQCNLAPGIPLGSALPEVDAFVKTLDLPPEYRYEFLGEAKLMADSNSNFAVAFFLAFVFMYMILAAQFESLVHPITILAAVPLTIPCALVSLLFLRTPLDVYAMIGLFMLFGIVKKNGILQVDYTNVLRAKGLPRDEAILAANEARLRPILMTTVMLVAAMIPIATGAGPGASARASMAKVILGGQLLSLLLTLLITPVAYSIWDDIERTAGRAGRWLMRRRGASNKSVATAAEEPVGAGTVGEPATVAGP